MTLGTASRVSGFIGKITSTLSHVIALIFICFIMTLLSFSLVSAQEDLPGEPSDDEINAVARQLYCPVCENIPLDVCPTQACAEWRDLIRMKLAEGWNSDQIRTYFVEQYGDRVLATPPPTGFNWLAYIIPPIAIALGIFLLYKAFQSMRSNSDTMLVETDPDMPEAPGEEDEYILRLEQQLRKR